MFSTYMAMNAWREILARAFEGVPGQQNASPQWLINPATKRRLKLDYLYPDIGVAIRFMGLQAKGQRRQSDWEALEDEQRNQTRAEMCRMNGVQMATINPEDEALKQIDGLASVLSRASRTLVQSNRPKREKDKWLPRLAEVRSRVADLRTRIDKNPEQMLTTLAERWRDREAGLVVDLAKDKGQDPKPKRRKALKLREGLRVVHGHFGEGVITEMKGEGDDAMISILFDPAPEAESAMEAVPARTFLSSLVQDKLEVAK